jgi:hypothetical protein
MTRESEAWGYTRIERKQQGLENTLIAGNPEDAAGPGAGVRRERLSGLLSFYYREAV